MITKVIIVYAMMPYPARLVQEKALFVLLSACVLGGFILACKGLDRERDIMLFCGWFLAAFSAATLALIIISHA